MLSNRIQLNSQNNHLGAKVSNVVVESQQIVHTLIVPPSVIILHETLFYKRTMANHTLAFTAGWPIGCGLTRSGQWRPLTPGALLARPGHCHSRSHGDIIIGSISHILHKFTAQQTHFISCFWFFVAHCEDEVMSLSIKIRQLMQLEYDDSQILMWYSAVLDISAASTLSQIKRVLDEFDSPLKQLRLVSVSTTQHQVSVLLSRC